GHGPSARSHGGRAARSLISGLDSTAFALAVYASPCQSPGPTQDSLLAAGQLYQVGLATHRAPTKGFRFLFLLSQPIPTQERPSPAAAAAQVGYELPETEMAAAVGCSDWFGLALEFPPGCNPAALHNPTTHASPQAVNRTGTTPCCKARSRFPISRWARPLLASRGRSHIASRDERRSDRKKVWVCFR